MTELQPLIDAALPGQVISLPDGEYDDPAPVRISKNVCLQGSRGAIIHSEIDVSGGVDAHFVGMTALMNKVGAPMKTGMPDFYPQNGMFQARNGAQLWLDDMQISALAGGGFSKPAVHCIASNLHLRAQTKLSVLNWINNSGPVIELLYGSYANIFCNGDEYAIPQNLQSGCAAGVPAITVAGSDLIMSGANMWRGGAGVLAINAGRASYVQIGAGKYTTLQGFGAASAAIALDAESRKVVASNTYIQ